MAVVSTLSNHYKRNLISGESPIGGHTYKCALMNTTFVFDRDTHATFADVLANEIATTGGYTLSGEALVVTSLTEDDTNNRARLAFDNKTFTASGESMAASGSAIIYDDTSSDDTVVGCIDFGTDYTTPNGSSLQIQSIVLDLS